MIEFLKTPQTFWQAPYCQAVKAGDFLFVTGQVAIDPATGKFVANEPEIQARRVMENLKIVLEYSGASFGQVVSTRVFLTDMRDYEVFNAVYGEYFGTQLPSRTCIGVTALAGGARVEVDFIIYLGE